MRVVLLSNKSQVLPWDYPHKLASAFYRSISKINEDLAYKLHRQLKYKPFTFSWIFGKTSVKGDLRIFPGKYSFFFSTPDRDLFSTFLTGVLEEPIIKIGRAEFAVCGVNVLSEPEFNGSPVHVRTLSPILVRTYKEGKRNPHWDLSPGDPGFFENLRKNLVKKYKSFYGKEPPNDTFKVLEIINPREKRIQIRNTYHRAWLMGFVVEGNSDLIKFGYQAGFGEKTGMGFGMVRVQ